MASLRADPLFLSVSTALFTTRTPTDKGTLTKLNCEELAITILIRRQRTALQVLELGDETGAAYANQTTVHFQSTIQLRPAGRDQLVVCLLALVPSRPRGRPALSGYHTGLYQCVLGSNPGLLINKCDQLQTRRHYRFLFFFPPSCLSGDSQKCDWISELKAISGRNHVFSPAGFRRVALNFFTQHPRLQSGSVRVRT